MSYNIEQIKAIAPSVFTTELTLPGKGEFYDIIFLDEMTRIYDEEYPNYINVIGLKSPN